MWIVSIALRRPYTFLMLALLIVLMGIYSILRTATDIFPNINIPITAVVWQYNGLQPEEIANRVVLFSERVAQTIVNDIEHTESQSVSGTAVVKYFFQPSAKEELAFSQITGASQTLLRFAPPGTTPPLILAYNASTVPILQLALSSDSLPESQIYDLGNNVLRTALATIPGAAVPFPYGGKQRQVQVDLDLKAMRARGLSGNDIIAAITAGNLVLPAGTEKIGESEYFIKLNSSPKNIDELNNLPIRAHDGTVIYIRDVAHVHDGYAPQTNMVRLDGRRAVLMNVLKTGNASTLDIINAVNAKPPQIRASLPPELKIEALSDQSVFVRSAITGVVREAVIAGALTGALILLFLGSWRSTLIITVSIPLSILASIVCLAALGETINIMTLGGLALAVGILVDDATVTIENINWHLEQGKSVRDAILDGAAQIVTPALVSLLCICIVFVPMLLLDGIARFLFVPMAEAVIFAMIASFVLSRTFVPMMAQYLLRPHASGGHSSGELAASMDPHGMTHHAPSKNPLVRFQRGFEQLFGRFRGMYRILLGMALSSRKLFITGFLAVVAASFLLSPFLGRNFFPNIDSGEIALHVRGPVGLRIEQTADLFDHVESTVRRTIPPNQLRAVIDNIGLPNSGINLTYNNSGTMGPSDGDILISLGEDHAPTAEYVKKLRRLLPRAYPGVTFSFLPADIISQILNFGAPAPIDVQVAGPSAGQNEAYAMTLLHRLRAIPGIADVRLQQSTHYPEFAVDVDRTRADQLGVTERNVTNSLVANLAGTFQVAPAFWLNPINGVSYAVVAQTPEYRMTSLNDLGNLMVTGKTGEAQILGGLATIKRGVGDAVVSHYNIEPLFDIYATTQGRDLGAVAAQINSIVHQTTKEVPKGSQVTVRGQVQTMNSAFMGLGLGLIAAIVLIYLLIVVNFHSWSDAFVIVTALPAALAGIVWMLFITHTPLSVPALTGAILCMGVATANSILVVTFARERLAITGNALVAAMEAGFTRFRPVLMTALAMIIGMLPMALGLGGGREQNAPLGRAVIGGLMCATIATLLFVPVVFSLVHRNNQAQEDHKLSGSGESHVH